MTNQIKNNKWKTIAIIFIVLFTLETSIWIWAFWDLTRDDARIKECYYDVCGEYPEANYEDDICYCYEYDFFGELVLTKTEYMK